MNTIQRTRVCRTLKKWKLKNGEYVEDIMYKYGSGCDHQHPVHSYILDIDDPIWAREFSEEQLEEISSAGRSALPELSDGVKNIFKVCSDTVKPFIPTSSSSAVTSAIDEKGLIDAIDAAVQGCGSFDPYTHFDERRLQRTLQEFFDMYRFNILNWLDSNGSEADFVANIWSLLDRSFQNLGVQTRRGQTPVAAKLGWNRDRAVSVDSEQTTFHPGLVFYRNDNEYGAAECGKEMIESQLHYPKLLKSMINLAGSKVDHDEQTIRSMRIIGLIQFHLQMRVSVLDCPAGYVCRVRTTPTYTIFTQPSMMTTGLLPILKLTWKAKVIVFAINRCIHFLMI
ncbi:hypothetical protein BJV82DRAFT_379524 [Fennellomyces sp. T-0311]|nr:hypothetical protein BJV82DRAFT_379524 [Fennellomyces sp. T-0311]